MLIISAVMLSSCFGNAGVQAKTISLDAYAINSDFDNISKIIIETKIKDEDVNKVMLDKMVEQNSILLPSGFSILSYNYTGDLLTVDCSEDITGMPEEDLISFSELCALTLNALGTVNTVKLTANGAAFPWAWENGYRLQLFGYADLQNIPIGIAKLYFPDKSGQFLKAESHIFYRGEGDFAYLMVNELSKGAYNKNNLTDILKPEDILSVQTDGTVCTVDLSPNFIKNVTGSTQQQMALYSIINSLTELPVYKSVMFLANGKSDVDFGNYNFQTEFVRNESLIH